MALQVWLPLNGNLSNQGLDGSISALSASSPIYADGKIGKCLNANAYATNALSFNSLNGLTTYSFCCWLKIATSETASDSYSRIFSIGSNHDGNTNDIRIEHIPTAGCFQIIFNKSGSYGSTVTYYGISLSSSSIAKDQWAHVAVTNDGINIRCYCNGILASITKVSNIYQSGYLTGKVMLGHSGGHCYLNDVRIYDHCLSAKEVSEIAKGLILHYPLNNGGFGAPNLLAKSCIVNRGCTSFSYDSINNLWNSVAPAGSSVWGYGVTFSNSTKISIPKGTTICFSLEVKPDIDCSCNADVNNSTIDGSNPSGNDNDDTSKRTTSGYNLKANIWNKVYWTYTAKNYDLYDANSNWGIQTTNLSSPVTFQIRNIKVEYGNKPTSWIPNSSDALYSAMGLNNMTEFDCSGYGNNGTRSGIIKWNGNTPRYLGSYEFNGSNTSIKNNSDTWHGGTINEKTISCWIKPNVSSCGGAGGIMAESANGAIMSMYNNIWQFANGSSWVNYNNGGITVGEWSHHACTIKDGVIKIYKNGNLISTNTNTSVLTTLSSSNYIAVGCDFPGGDEYFNGLISDFRIYSTALSDSDIKELYNSPISIDKSGNLYAYEFREV